MHFFDCNDCARISCLQNATSSDVPIRDLADILITDYYWVLIMIADLITLATVITKAILSGNVKS